MRAQIFFTALETQRNIADWNLLRGFNALTFYGSLSEGAWEKLESCIPRWARECARRGNARNPYKTLRKLAFGGGARVRGALLGNLGGPWEGAQGEGGRARHTCPRGVKLKKICQNQDALGSRTMIFDLETSITSI